MTTALDDRFIEAVRGRLERNERVRRSLPAGGRLNIDRQLPFLVVYRPPPGRDDEGTRDFVRGEASYLITPSDRRRRPRLRQLAETVVRTLSASFGGFLIIEIWAGPETTSTSDEEPVSPGFRVVSPRRFADSPSVRAMTHALERVELFKRPAEVELVRGGRIGAKGMGPLVTAKDLSELDAHAIGVEIRPVYRNRDTGEVYPFAKRRLVRQVSRAIREACFEFARRETAARPRHYEALGSRAFTRAARDVDAALAEISTEYDLLLYVSPINVRSAWAEFQRTRHQRAPGFQYRPRDFDPDHLKRRLHEVHLDRVEDPTLAHVFREKKAALDLELSLLLERERPEFLPLSAALYGLVEPSLLATARELLDTLPDRERGRTRTVGADQFVVRAREALEDYRRSYPELPNQVHVRDDISSLMVSQGDLLVGRAMRFPGNRVEPLLQHEVGTHVVTHWNGRAQPLKLLSAGLAHDEELQEGLAVFAEYLAAGLTPTRMRTLAARVVAAHAVLDGAGFVDVWRMLTDDHAFRARAAFQITTRVFRGGGFVKDSVYLRGLQSVLSFLEDGGHLETLLVGKIATEHAPIIEELQRRRVLHPAPLRPAYLDDPDGQDRLDRARGGLRLPDLVER